MRIIRRGCKLQETDLKKLTLLHSNDLHGDFLAEKVDDELAVFEGQ